MCLMPAFASIVIILRESNYDFISWLTSIGWFAQLAHTQKPAGMVLNTDERKRRKNYRNVYESVWFPINKCDTSSVNFSTFCVKSLLHEYQFWFYFIYSSCSTYTVRVACAYTSVPGNAQWVSIGNRINKNYSLHYRGFVIDGTYKQASKLHQLPNYPHETSSLKFNLFAIESSVYLRALSLSLSFVPYTYYLALAPLYSYRTLTLPIQLDPVSELKISPYLSCLSRCFCLSSLLYSVIHIHTITHTYT